MLRRSLCFFLLLQFGPFVVAKDPPALPKLVVNAKYVLVTTYSGDEFSNRIDPEDRQAVVDVQNVIRAWGRYALVDNHKDADLIIVVRKGRIGEALLGKRIHAGSERSDSTVGETADGDVGDPLDTLAIHDPVLGIDSPPLWRGREKDGLKGAEMRLVNELRTRVDEDAKKP